MDLSSYLQHNESMDLDRVFTSALSDDPALVFWTGISPDLAKSWAGQNNMKTLTMAMGSLYNDQGPGSLRAQKSSPAWSRFMIGASGVFAQHACHRRRAIVLTKPPPDIYSKRPRSNYRDIEEPILQGLGSETHTQRIDYVHPIVPGAACFVYQKWPDDRSCEWFEFLDALSIKVIPSNVTERRAADEDPGEVAGVVATRVNDLYARLKALASSKEKEQAEASPNNDQPEAERKTAKRLEHEEKQRKARERKVREKEARRLKHEEKQRKARERKAKKKEAKRLRHEEKQRKAREEKAAKRCKAEEQERQAREKKEAKRLKRAADQRLLIRYAG